MQQEAAPSNLFDIKPARQSSSLQDVLYADSKIDPHEATKEILDIERLIPRTMLRDSSITRIELLLDETDVAKRQRELQNKRPIKRYKPLDSYFDYTTRTLVTALNNAHGFFAGFARAWTSALAGQLQEEIIPGWDSASIEWSNEHEGVEDGFVAAFTDFMTAKRNGYLAHFKVDHPKTYLLFVQRGMG